MSERLKCPECKTSMRRVNKKDSLVFRGVKIRYQSQISVCPACGLESATIDQAASIQEKILREWRKHEDRHKRI